MGFNQGDSINGQGDPSSAPKWYMLNCIMCVRNSKAAGKIDEAFSYFEESLGMMLCFMDIQTRKDIEKDYRQYKELRNKIEKDTTLNPTSKAAAITKLKFNFMEEHRGYLFLALPNANVLELESDAEIDFNKISFEDTKRIVRRGSTETGIRESGADDEPDTAANPGTD